MDRHPDYQFVPTDTEALEALMISSYETITGVSVTPASPEKLFIKWVSSIILQERALNNYTGNQNIPSRATGSNLDALGELFYASERPEAQPAVCTVLFEISAPQASPILIPAGTRVTDASSTLYWETIEDAYVEAGDTGAEVQVRCQTEGTAGNGYAVGQINTIVDVYDYYSACANITVSDGGADAATDAEYYELLRESMYAFSTAGPSGAYVYHAKSVSTEIADVKAVRPKAVKSLSLPLYEMDGDLFGFLGGDDLDAATLQVYPEGGTVPADPDTDYTASYEDGLLCIAINGAGALAEEAQIDVTVNTSGAGQVKIYVLMDDGTIAGETIKGQVLAACSEESVRPLTDHVSIDDPETVTYDINLTWYIAAENASRRAEIEEAVSAAIAEYEVWQRARLGRDINPSHLIGLLMQTGVKRVEVTSPVFTQLRDGSDSDVPQIAVLNNTAVTYGGAEDD